VGEQVYKSHSESKQQAIDLSGKPAGTYILNIANERTTNVARILL
jgi:hypothetical protein